MTLSHLRSLRPLFLFPALALACGGSDGGEDEAASGGAGFGGTGATHIGGTGAVTTGGTATGATSGSGGGAVSGATGGTAGVGIFECPGYDLPTECGSTAQRAEVRPVNILIVFDKSGSMGGVTTNVETKWQAATESLDRALSGLKGYAQFGFQFFPRKEVPMQCAASCCDTGGIDVPIGPGEQTVPQISSLILADEIGPGGYTPTAAALGYSYEYLREFINAGVESNVGDTFLFLITDGGPNCNGDLTCGIDRCTFNMDLTPEDPGYELYQTHNVCEDPTPGALNCLDDAATVAQIAEIGTLGVKTVVIGIPGSEVYGSVLTQMAVAGGARPDYYKVSDPHSLEDAFIDIATDLITSCEIFLEQAPPDAEKVNVAIECATEPQLDASGTPRWELDTTVHPPKLILNGELCQKAETQGLGRLDVVFGCPTLT